MVFFRSSSIGICRKRLSASYSMAPLIQIGLAWKSDELKEATQRKANPFENLEPREPVPPAQICAFGTLDEIYVA
jgi:hypothetical protein